MRFETGLTSHEFPVILSLINVYHKLIKYSHLIGLNPYMLLDITDRLTPLYFEVCHDTDASFIQSLNKFEQRKAVSQSAVVIC